LLKDGHCWDVHRSQQMAKDECHICFNIRPAYEAASYKLEEIRVFMGVIWLEVERLSRDNLDENGGGNQSLRRRPVASYDHLEFEAAQGFSVPLLIVAERHHGIS